MKLKIVTSNPGKVREFEKALGGAGIATEHVSIPYDEVQTSSLREVVAKGIEELRKKGLNDFIIDDSGLFIQGLGGFPGVYSAYAQKTIGNEGILKLMDGVSERNAEFKCCIGCDLNGDTMIAEGVCSGTILHEEHGSEGFGFDPVFSPGGNRSFAEMSMDEKNPISHRGAAIKVLLEELRKR